PAGAGAGRLRPTRHRPRRGPPQLRRLLVGRVLLRLVRGGLLLPPLGLVLWGLLRILRFPRLLLSWPHGWKH
ncbi:hypothetical protein PV341_23370, partial [Streptomyces sp. PA03-1a]|nr:hypothetical protein [Streptomyces sp. PA03-1a]